MGSRAGGSVADVERAVRHVVRWSAVHVAMGTGVFAYGLFGPGAGGAVRMAVFAAAVAGLFTAVLGAAAAAGWARTFAAGAAAASQAG